MVANIEMFLFDFQSDNKTNVKRGAVDYMYIYARNVMLFYQVNRVLKVATQNIAITLKVHGIDSLEKIDGLLITIETAMEKTEELLESTELKGWYNAPVRWLANKAYNRACTFEILVSSLYSRMMHHENSFKNSKI